MIRFAENKDLKSIQQVARVSWNTTYEGIIPREVQDNFLKTAYSDEMMERRLKHSLLLVAEVEGKIVGFANFSPVRDNGDVELGAIYLYPASQGMGLGTALLQKGIEELEGVKKIYINVEKENEIGKRFYDAKGFKIVSEFDDDFDGHILKTVRMELIVGA